MLTTAALTFLRDLAQHNSRDWFQANKARYERELKKPWEHTIQALLDRLTPLQPALSGLVAKDTIFRIHRDTRFSADKTPYKTNVSAIVAPGGRKNMHYPGFYVHLEGGMLMLGGGAYFLDKPYLEKVRRAIANDPDALANLVDQPDFREVYGEVRGEQNKVLPAEFKAVRAQEPRIAHKQFYVMAELPPEMALGEGFLDLAEAHFQTLQPLNTFLADTMFAEA